MWMLRMILMLLTTAGAAVAAPKGPTFNRAIAPILFEHCAECHRPGEVAPFPLLTYQDAAAKAGTIAKVVQRRLMPPWKPEAGPHRILGERRLTEAQIDAIVRWVDGGRPEGDAADLPSPPVFTSGWKLGEPDLVLTMDEAFEVPAEGRDIYRCFVLPTNITETRTVAAAEFRPGNPSVVHHAIMFLDATGRSRQRDAADPGPGYRSFGGIGGTPTGELGGWAPGYTPRFLPEGVGRLMLANSDVVVQVHYNPSGKVETDRSTIGIYFTKTFARELMTAIAIGTHKVHIPAGEKRHRITAEMVLPVDVTILGSIPHMHLLGKEMTLTAVLPDGTATQLIRIPDWDFNWQDQYIYAEPIKLPAGAKLQLEAFYDNSSDNPRNPHNPPQDVRFGEQTSNEMCFCFVQMVPSSRIDLLKLIIASGDQLGVLSEVRKKLNLPRN